MDDIVRSAVKAAMAREADLFDTKADGLQPDSTMPGCPRQARRKKVYQDESCDGSGSATNALAPKGMTKLRGGKAETASGATAGLGAPSTAQKGKGLSSNWVALRAKMPRHPKAVTSAGVSKRRPRTSSREKSRKEPTEETPAEKPLACSMFAKGALRTGASVKPTKVVALDCEFVGVGVEGQTDALARVSVVNFRGEILYDSFVRVEMPVVDYRTRFSGVRPEDISGSLAVDPREARAEVAELLKGRILVGHAVGNDLRVLRINHPRRDIRDTSEFYKRLWKREGRRGGAPPALRLVVARVLGVDQFQTSEHDSCEDARAALSLYKKNAKEWESSKPGLRGTKAGKGKKAK